MITKQSHREHMPVVEIVDRLLQQAIAHRASDIHLESLEAGLRVRFRIDGMLYDQERINQTLAHQVISRLKVLAHLDITERRIPQDGKFQITTLRHPIDLRISTFPSLHGEKMVVRILDRARTAITLDGLGLLPEMLASVKKMIQQAQGFLLVAGPTGSGKTTTLYAALSLLNEPYKNIITLEDPVEYNVEGVTQGQINPDVGFSFEKGMRAILRQDPDVVMIGEIRDKQTAHIAIEASLTGHMVLSTVHTHDALSVLTRLLDMGIEPFLLNAALQGVVAQRLARTVCQECRIAYEPTEQERTLLDRHGAHDITVLYKGKGCSTCLNIGCKGRVGIFEFLPIDAGLRALMTQNPSFQLLQEHIRSVGLPTLCDDGLAKVRQGTISLAELVRVLL